MDKSPVITAITICSTFGSLVKDRNERLIDKIADVLETETTWQKPKSEAQLVIKELKSKCSSKERG